MRDYFVAHGYGENVVSKGVEAGEIVTKLTMRSVSGRDCGTGMFEKIKIFIKDECSVK